MNFFYKKMLLGCCALVALGGCNFMSTPSGPQADDFGYSGNANHPASLPESSDNNLLSDNQSKKTSTAIASDDRLPPEMLSLIKEANQLGIKNIQTVEQYQDTWQNIPFKHHAVIQESLQNLVEQKRQELKQAGGKKTASDLTKAHRTAQRMIDQQASDLSRTEAALARLMEANRLPEAGKFDQKNPFFIKTAAIQSKASRRNHRSERSTLADKFANQTLPTIPNSSNFDNDIKAISQNKNRDDLKQYEPKQAKKYSKYETTASYHQSHESWKVILTAAIGSLEQELDELDEAEPSEANLQKHAHLRMMYMVAGQRDKALRELPGVKDENTKQFWAKTIYGLDTYLNSDDLPNKNRRAALATATLTEALVSLQQQATLEVQNLAFCNEVTNFGVYQEMVNPKGEYVFAAGDEVLLYAEVKNFVSEQIRTTQKYHTVLKATYQLFDAASGRTIGAEHRLSRSEDRCKNRRTDFFVRYFLKMPGNLSSGEYRLRLSVEDVKGNKVGESEILFKIAVKK